MNISIETAQRLEITGKGMWNSCIMAVNIFKGSWSYLRVELLEDSQGSKQEKKRAPMYACIEGTMQLASQTVSCI